MSWEQKLWDCQHYTVSPAALSMVQPTAPRNPCCCLASHPMLTFMKKQPGVIRSGQKHLLVAWGHNWRKRNSHPHSTWCSFTLHRKTKDKKHRLWCQLRPQFPGNGRCGFPPVPAMMPLGWAISARSVLFPVSGLDFLGPHYS